MTTLRLVLSAMNGRFAEAIEAKNQPIATAVTAAIHDAGDLALKEGRSEIGRGGFGPKWQRAFRVRFYPPTGSSLEPAAFVWSKIPYAGVFQSGAKIAGSPLLWLPLPNVPATISGRRMTPANFAKSVGPLHTINVPGRAPMLAAYMRGAPPKSGKVSLSRLRAGSALARLGVRQRRGAAGTAGVTSVPVFVGVKAVQLHRHFNLKAVADRARREVPNFYLKRIAEQGGTS